MSPIFLDTNIPIYAAGRPHPLKLPCVRILEFAAERPLSFVTSTEVLQELLHRYLSLRLWPQGRTVLQEFAALMSDRIEPIIPDDVLSAAASADLTSGLSARDCVHAAVMRRAGSSLIATADRGFERVPGVRRLDPSEIDVWHEQLFGPA